MWKIYAQKPAPIAAIVILSVISFNTRIQALETADGGLPGYFMNEGTGARALGMGRAFTAVADDASAIYWNPAGLARARQEEVLFMHSQLFKGEDTRYESVSYAYTIGENITVGAGACQLYSGNFTRRDDNNNPIGTFSDQNNAYFFGIAMHHASNVSFGLTGKILNKQLDGFSANGYGADLGFMIRPFKLLKSLPIDQLTVGLLLQNVLPPHFDRLILTDDFPFLIRAGLAYRWADDITTVDHQLVASIDVQKSERTKDKYYAGVEYSYLRRISFRVGYDNGNYVGGVGGHLGAVRLDYALSKNKDLDLAHKLSLSYRFGVLRKGSVTEDKDEKASDWSW